ncbi:MAG: hypothetical protein H7A23_20650 [Leptospiraceae bacterium]|nr:hypothetical protein [Leptospiraceae bacterium]MCP5496971.1 hypothetical protein [Leptospiraceae bacterium]
MRRFIKLSYVVLLVFAFGLNGQPPEKKAEKEPAIGKVQPNKPEPKKEASAPVTDHKEMKEYFPLSYYDFRLKVKNVSFERRYAPDGKGEILDVHVQMEGDYSDKDGKPLDYKIFVLALNESDGNSPLGRTMVSYPSWRKGIPSSSSVIPHKSTNQIHFSRLVGDPDKIKDITPEEVSGKKVQDLKKDLVEKNQLKGEEIRLEEPTLWEYVLYLSKNSDKALDFKLYGEKGPQSEAERVSTNYPKAKIDEESKKDILNSVPEHTYTIYYSKYKTSVFTHHYTMYRPDSDYYFFNKVVVLIFDPSRDKDNKNENNYNRLVHRSVHTVGKMRVR